MIKEFILAERLEIQPNELLIISNHGEFIVEIGDWDAFQEDQQVTWGEEGGYFETLLVVDSNNSKYNYKQADQYFGGD